MVRRLQTFCLRKKQTAPNSNTSHKNIVFFSIKQNCNCLFFVVHIDTPNKHQSNNGRLLNGLTYFRAPGTLIFSQSHQKKKKKNIKRNQTQDNYPTPFSRVQPQWYWRQPFSRRNSQPPVAEESQPVWESPADWHSESRPN